MDVAQELKRQFPGIDYYKQVVEGRQMIIEEIKDSPIRWIFFVLLDEAREKVLLVVRRRSLGLIEEENSAIKPEVLADFVELLKFEKLNPWIFA